jgi:SAM-dependent methyltransferase
MHQSAYDHMKSCVEKYMNPNEKLSVLDFGSRISNPDHLTHRTLFNGYQVDYIGADLKAGANVDVVIDEPYSLPLDSSSFDIVLSGQVFEHIPFFWVSSIEISRILKLGGYLFLVAPSRGHVHSHPFDCWRFYPDGYKSLAAFAGLELVSVHTDFPSIKENGRFNYESIPSARYWGDTVGVFRKISEHSEQSNGLFALLKSYANKVGGREYITKNSLNSVSNEGSSRSKGDSLNGVKRLKYGDTSIKLAVKDSVVSDIIQEKIKLGKYERQEAATIKKLVSKNDILLELGAGLGLISTIAWQTGMVDAVHAFEADPRLIPLIENTFESHGVRGKVYNEILTSDPDVISKGSREFYIRQDFYGSSVVDGVGKKVVEKIDISVGSFAIAIDKIRPTVIACDIEGGEMNLFKDVDLSSVRHIMLETHQGTIMGSGMRDLFNDLHALDFHFNEVYSRGSVSVFTKI